MSLNILKFPIDQLTIEDVRTEKYSHPAYVRKLPIDINCISDFSPTENMIEFEMESGN